MSEEAIDAGVEAKVESDEKDVWGENEVRASIWDPEPEVDKNAIQAMLSHAQQRQDLGVKVSC